MKTFNFSSTSYDFLHRAEEELGKFDNGQHGSIFYAALNLRFGIEARLYEYIRAAYRQNNNDAEIKEFVATKLLRKLIDIEPDWSNPCQIRFHVDGANNSGSLGFTPVTKKLAEMHGRLGEMLHYKFFENNPSWYIDIELKDGYRNLRYYRQFLDDVRQELSYALSGSLLGHPKFTELVLESESAPPINVDDSEGEK